MQPDLQEAHAGSAEASEALPRMDALSLVLDKERILANRNKGLEKQGAYLGHV